MKVLGLDLSTKTGYAVFYKGKLIDYGRLAKVEIEDFNVNDYPNKSPKYPKNIIIAAETVADQVMILVNKVKPDKIVIENSVKGRNRHTQRFIEYMHFCVSKALGCDFVYMDPSEWRSIVGMKMSNDDKKNNREVKAGKKRGKITKKHLSVRLANANHNLSLKMKDEDVADAANLAHAYVLSL